VERKSKIDATGAFILLAIMIMLGLNQVGIKIVNDGIPPVLQAGLRSLAALPILLLLCRLRGAKIPTDRDIHIPGLLTGFCFAAEFALLFQALNWTSVARASIFFYTMPFWVALAAHFLIPGERLTLIRILGLVLAILGVTIALSNSTSTSGPYALFGDLMALLGAVGWASIAIIARTTKFSTIKPEAQLFYQLIVSAALLLPLSLMLGDALNQPAAYHWAIFALQVVFVVCTCFLLWFWVLSVYPASDMASFSFLAPVFGALFAWLILDEPLTFSIIIALALVALGILLVNRK